MTNVWPFQRRRENVQFNSVRYNYNERPRHYVHTNFISVTSLHRNSHYREFYLEDNIVSQWTNNTKMLYMLNAQWFLISYYWLDTTWQDF